jgi:lysophospholipase L1-like esterase
MEIDEYIQNEAIGGTHLGWGIPRIFPNIPDQYANARAANDGPYDVVVLTGGGNDLRAKCKLTRRSCTESCADKMEEIVDEMETLVTEIVRDGSDVIMVGYYPFYQSKKITWYDECFSEMNSMYQEIADTSPHVSFVSTTDLANPDNPSDYAPDGLHPSIALTKKIGRRVADAF